MKKYWIINLKIDWYIYHRVNLEKQMLSIVVAIHLRLDEGTRPPEAKSELIVSKS